MPGIKDLSANQAPQSERDHHQIWADILTNVSTLERMGIVVVSKKHELFLNERPEVFNKIFGFEAPVQIEATLVPEVTQIAEFAGETAIDHLVAS